MDETADKKGTPHSFIECGVPDINQGTIYKASTSSTDKFGDLFFSGSTFGSLFPYSFFAVDAYYNVITLLEQFLGIFLQVFEAFLEHFLLKKTRMLRFAPKEMHYIEYDSGYNMPL